MPKKRNCPKGTGPPFVREFRHHKSGKLIRASDYGLKAFPMGSRKKRK